MRPRLSNGLVSQDADRLALDNECGYPVDMQSPVLSRADAVQRLSAIEDEIRGPGVTRLALFGSVLHGTDARRQTKGQRLAGRR